jgi:glycosyltransferase involved in cell wall biosynthesis
MRSQKFEIINAHLPRSELASAIATLFVPSHLIITKHNSERFWPNGVPRISRALAEFVEESACATICITRAVLEFLIKNQESDGESCFVVHYGIKQENERIEVRRNYSQNREELKIICVARLEPQKNLFRLIDLIPRLADLNPKLRIFGLGSQKSLLNKQIQERSLGNRIEICGFTDDARGEMKKSRLFILPSNYEGFGLVLLEALDEGCIVVASSIPAVTEVLGEDYPFLFRPDSVSEMELRVRQALFAESEWLSNYRSKVLKKFNLKRQFDKTDIIYRHCLNHSLGKYADFL